MFRSEHIAKTLVLAFSWTTTVVTFYALTLNATTLSGDVLLNVILSRAIKSFLAH